jgi:hypothetical protein
LAGINSLRLALACAASGQAPAADSASMDLRKVSRRIVVSLASSVVVGADDRVDGAARAFDQLSCRRLVARDFH